MTSLAELVIRGERVATPEGVRRASIHIQKGRIAAVAAHEEIPPGVPVHDAGPLVVMPGLVDAHVHVNEPGRTEWEGFASATRAAAAGGVTTLVDMPLNSIPPTTTLEGFRRKLDAAQGNCWVDVGFWGGVVPGNGEQLRPLFDAGVLGFKCFLICSGVDEFGHVAESDLRLALPRLSEMGALLAVHAELPGPVEEAFQAMQVDCSSDPRSYSTFLRSRPRKAESDAVALSIRLSREFGCRIHIVHLSSSDALPLLREARSAAVRISAETCPHYLCLAAEDIAEGATQFKCCPPIRERGNAEKLWAALGEGLIEMVVSDHSPCPPELKLKQSGDFSRAWSGISSLQLRLALIWTAAERRGYSLQDLSEWLCGAPVRLVGLQHRKGSVQKGCDADFVVWDPEASFRVEPGMLHHRHKLTPYAGSLLRGAVETTFLRGRKIYHKGRFASAPIGTMLLRGSR